MKDILIFSDTHARLPLMFKLIWLFQKEHKTNVDLVLVTGDLGVWPDISNLDNSTYNYLTKKREYSELGFLAFNSIYEYTR